MIRISGGSSMTSRIARAAPMAWLLLLVVLGAAAPGRRDTRAAPADSAVAAPPVDPIPASSGIVVLDTALGTMALRLFEDDAPLTCANFKKLVRSHYYDSTYFHRVMAGFMIQGGDPNTRNASPDDDGTGGPGYTIPAEIKRPHLRGSVAAARRGAAVNPKRESSGSQFFIEVAAQPRLDEEGYTVFGQLIDGFGTLDRIEKAGSETGLPAAAGGGTNPGRIAAIRSATWMTYAKWQEQRAAPPQKGPPKR
jgi:cyclophilin family peptidyl-prolyl cis-trans isomerase